MANRIQLRRDITANWENINPVLADGEPGYDINTNEVRVGDGSTSWTGLSGNVIGGGGGGGASTGDVTFSGINIIGNGNLKIQPSVSSSSSYIDVFLTGGSDIHIASNNENLILGGDTTANVMAHTDGQVYIQSNAGTPRSWKFKDSGALATPLATSGIIIDATAANLITGMTQNQTVDFPGFSGEILVNDIVDGFVYKLLVGSGKVCMMGTTNDAWDGTFPTPSATYTLTGEFTIEFVGASSLYRFTNLKSGTRDMNFVAIQSRPAA